MRERFLERKREKAYEYNMIIMVEYFLWNVWKDDEKNKRKREFCYVVGFGRFK